MCLRSPCPKPARARRQPSPSRSIVHLSYELPLGKGVTIMASTCSPSTRPYTASLKSPGGMSMADKRATSFDPKTCLARVRDSKSTLQCQKHQMIFAQGDAANAVFYIQEGHV